MVAMSLSVMVCQGSVGFAGAEVGFLGASAAAATSSRETMRARLRMAGFYHVGTHVESNNGVCSLAIAWQNPASIFILLERAIHDCQRASILDVADVGQSQQAAKSLGRDVLHRARRIGRAGRGLRKGRGAGGVEGDVAFG